MAKIVNPLAKLALRVSPKAELMEAANPKQIKIITLVQKRFSKK
jgi:hypothetical protein